MSAQQAWKLSIENHRSTLASEINMVAKHGCVSNHEFEDYQSEVSSMCIEEEIIATAI